MIESKTQTRPQGGIIRRLAVFTVILALAIATVSSFFSSDIAAAKLAEAENLQSQALERQAKAERQVTFTKQTFDDWDKTYSACGPRFGYLSETCEILSGHASEARIEFRAAQGRATNAADELADATKLYEAARVGLEESRIRHWLLLSLTLAVSSVVALYIALKSRAQRAARPAPQPTA
jgi:hypothetical protein